VAKDVLIYLSKNLKKLKKKDLLEEAFNSVIKCHIGKLDKFEESDAILREDLAELYEDAKMFSEAASTLEPIRFTLRKVNKFDQLKFHVKVA